MNKFFVTTPIYYVNDKPHIGHVYSTLAADILSRYWRQKLGPTKVWFSTGTDENSQKTVEAAAKAGKDVKPYTDELADVWKSTFKQLGIGFNDFIRTTEPRHRKAVEHLIGLIEKNGDIYKGKYEGWYCIGHEAFLKESDLVDGKCPEHNRKPEWLVEENYFFKLSKYQKPLEKFYADHPNFVVPDTRFNEVKQFVKQGLEDISISRQTQKWGIPLPQDQKHVIYVWFDALINYLTTIGYPDKKYKDWWPGTHIIGKDILKFHAIIWPAMLMSAGVEPPKQIVANGFFTIDGKKISKSLGNTVDPLDLQKKYGDDALRYFLFREIPFGSDGDFSEDKMKERYTADLANGLGNLVSRVTNMLEKYADGKYVIEEVGEAENYWLREKYLMYLQRKQSDRKKYDDYIQTFRFDQCLSIVWTQIDDANKLIDEQEPWAKAKIGKNIRPFLNELAHRVLEINDLLRPFLPDAHAKINAAFQMPVKKAEPLFPRLDQKL